MGQEFGSSLVGSCGSWAQSWNQCAAEASVLSEGLTGGGSASNFIYELVEGLSSLQSIGLRAPVPHGLLLEAVLSSLPLGPLWRAAHAWQLAFLRVNV